MQAFLVIVLLTTLSLTSARADVLLSAPFIKGSTRYSSEEFVEIFASRMGQPVSRALVDAIAADIQNRYRRDGYVAPSIVALDAELRSSTPVIHVFEAAIDEIALRGDVGPYSDRIMDEAQVLRAGPLERGRIQFFLRRMNELAGLTVRARFEPHGVQPARMTLVLDSEYTAFDGAMTVNNRGNADLGHILISGRISSNGLLGADSTVSLYGATSEESDRYRFTGVGFERGLGSARGRLDVSSSRAELLDGYVYESQRARLLVSSTAFADEHVRVRPFAAFTWRDAEGKYPGLQMSEVRSRVAEVGVTTQHSGDRTAGYSRAAFSRGVGGLGASTFVNNGVAPEISFSKASFDFAVIRVLASQWRMRIDAEGQWSDADLPAGERFTFGGAQFGRAFDAAELGGDTGGAVSVQIERVQTLRNRWLQQSSLYLQSDYGYARDHVYGTDTASSIAAGWKLAFTSILANLELSTPLRTPLQDAEGSSSTDSVRAFAQLQILF